MGSPVVRTAARFVTSIEDLTDGPLYFFVVGHGSLTPPGSTKQQKNGRHRKAIQSRAGERTTLADQFPCLLGAPRPPDLRIGSSASMDKSESLSLTQEPRNPRLVASPNERAHLSRVKQPTFWIESI